MMSGQPGPMMRPGLHPAAAGRSATVGTRATRRKAPRTPRCPRQNRACAHAFVRAPFARRGRCDARCESFQSSAVSCYLGTLHYTDRAAGASARSPSPIFRKRREHSPGAAQPCPFTPRQLRLAQRGEAAAMADPKLLASLDLMRRMPPSRMESSLEGPLAPKRQFAASAATACALPYLLLLLLTCLRACAWLAPDTGRAPRPRTRPHR